VDAAIGRILEEVERLGMATNTVVMLTSDNGYFLGDRGFAGKWQPHEPSLRVPLIIFDPRLTDPRAGKQVKVTVLNIDIAPTILDLAGVKVPPSMQGRSLVPLMKGKTPANWRKDFFHEHLFDHPDIPKYEGVRTPRYKYARWFEQKPAHEELYDMQTDPLEANNLANDERHSELLGRLRKRCNELRDLYGGVYVSQCERRDPVPVAGVIGKALRFDGKGASIDAGTIPALRHTDSFTWSFWVKLEANTPRPAVIVGNRRVDGKDLLQFIKFTTHSFQYCNTRKHTVKLWYKLPMERWVHVAVVKNAEWISYYADGWRVSKGKANFDMPGMPFYLGGDFDAREMAACALDEVRIYGRPLSADEIQKLAEKEPIPDGLIEHWPMEAP
jgi:hypothetical protein